MIPLTRAFRYISRWTVFQIDVLICALSLFLGYLLRFNFEIPAFVYKDLLWVFLTVLLVKIIFFYLIKSYAGIIRYTSIEDAKKIFLALTASAVVILVINEVYTYYRNDFFIPVSVILIDYFLSLLFMAAFRVLAKIIFLEWKNYHSEKVRVLIYGAGESGAITKKTLDQDGNTNYKVVGFVDDDDSKAGNMLDGVRIYKVRQDFKRLLTEKKVNLVIVAIQHITPARKKEVVDICLNEGVQVRHVPPVENWINGELSLNQIREIKIEDVLGREEIQLDTRAVQNEIRNKVLLVTGAAGSIGSEIVRQVVNYHPKKVVLLDQAESMLHDLATELVEQHVEVNFESVLGDVRCLEKMEGLIKEHQPDIIYHAAAYKHVPVMERHPEEAVRTNILGTRHVADLAVKYGAEKFVMVSTDKAVNPTSIMGASKRIAEIYTQALNNRLSDQHEDGHTRFITTRFGNVLGSSGSVIPRFRKQINSGGPVTITHPEIRRYFMTIPEACQLVLEAGSMGQGGEIYLFDMGESIRILDLAKKMIKLSGLTLGKDIQIVYTGLRSGEKLYEELLSDVENTEPTYNPKIMIARVRKYDYCNITNEIEKLFDMKGEAMIEQVQYILPEYQNGRSGSSDYTTTTSVAR